VSKGLESYEQYFENIQLFEYELKLNILSSRARLFQQYKIEICKKKLLVETNRIRHDQQDLEMISGKLASLRSQQTGLTAVNSSEQKKFEKNEQKIKKLEFLEGIRKTEFEDSKAASNELNAEITSIIQKIDQLDHDRAEREYLQIQSIKSAGRSPRSTPAMGPELPTFFWLDSGAVVSAFTLEPGVRARPKTNKGEESNLKLEDSDVREAPM
jgi:hypothetical protein